MGPNDALPELLSQALAWQLDRFTELLVTYLPQYFGRVLGQSR